MTRQRFFTLAAAASFGGTALAQQSHPESGLADAPVEPGQPWHVHDPARSHPAVVIPAAAPGMPPSDAVVLFDGSALARWHQPVGAGYFEVAPDTGGRYACQVRRLSTVAGVGFTRPGGRRPSRTRQWRRSAMRLSRPVFVTVAASNESQAPKERLLLQGHRRERNIRIRRPSGYDFQEA
jgi:hypothetical protein